MPYFKTTIRAGKTIEVHKGYVKRQGVSIRGGKQKVTPEEMDKINEMNARRKLKIKINANFGEGDPFVTLTYRKGERPSKEEAKERIKALLKELRKIYKKQGSELKYINVTEYENKAIHHHLILNDLKNGNIAKIINTLWIYGRPNYKYLDSSGQYKDLADYLIKETSKTYKKNKEEGKGHKQRYSCSKNLVMPEPKTEIIKANKWTADPKPIKGYYVDQDSVFNGIDPFTGREYQRYTLIEISKIQNPFIDAG